MEEEVCGGTLGTAVNQCSHLSPQKRKRKQVSNKKLKISKQDSQREDKGLEDVVNECCPICQVPLKSLRIIPESHVNNCEVIWQDLPGEIILRFSCTNEVKI